MRQRTLNPNADNYKYYGGRDNPIRICYEWRDSFGIFYKQMGKSYYEHVAIHGEARTSIDRIDNNGFYGPGNCRWTTPEIQSRNRRMQKSNNSGVVGVYWDKTRGKWRAQITVNKKNISLGYFTDFDLAVEARKDAEAKYFAEIA